MVSLFAPAFEFPFLFGKLRINIHCHPQNEDKPEEKADTQSYDQDPKDAFQQKTQGINRVQMGKDTLASHKADNHAATVEQAKNQFEENPMPESCHNEHLHKKIWFTGSYLSIHINYTTFSIIKQKIGLE